MILYYFLIGVFLLLSLLLCGIIMMQEGKSLGLGSAFGGDTQDSLFGVSTAEVLKKITAWMFVIFLVLCIALSFWTTSIGKKRLNAQKAAVEQVERS